MAIQQKLPPNRFQSRNQCQLHAGLRRRGRRNRQGITLILVISIIVLFLLLGTSFVVMSQNYLSSSKARIAKLKVRGDSGKVLIQRALYDVLRGPGILNLVSPLRGHSLLEDQYGYGITSRVAGAIDVGYSDPSELVGNSAGLGLFEIELFDPATFTMINSSGMPDPLSPATGAYNGLVFTFVTGPAKGMSCRIVSYYVFTNPGPPEQTVKRFIIAPEWTERSNAFALVDLIGSEVVINGRPFAGKGAGGLLNPMPVANINQPALQANALLPNRMGESPSDFILNYASSGANEPWDAIDYQNMFLAGDGNVHASFDRPSLYQYGADPRRSFRAFGVPTDPLPLQVDNDGDGIPDSIWMDIGLPIQTDVSGRLYRPLVAYRIVDMDGRFNLNAHGNGFDSDRANGVAYDTARVTTPGEPIMGGVTNDQLSTGMGVGPAEISLAPLFDPFFLEYQNVLFGELTSQYPGRYTSTYDAIPGGSPGIAGIPDNSSERLMYNKYVGYPRLAFDNVREGIVDLSGRFAHAYWFEPPGSLPIGLPAIDAVSNLTNELIDSPYDIEFGRTKSGMVGMGVAQQHDQLFSPRELERLLRAFDIDAKFLPSRLAILAPETFISDLDNRRKVTTESWEIPTPPSHLVERLFPLVARPVMAANGVLNFDDLPPLVQDDVRRQVNFLLSPDLMRGQKFDVNRPFGNGIDDSGNFVIDEYFHPGTGSDEASSSEFLETVNADLSGALVNTSVELDLNNNNLTNEPNEAYFARQNYMRHLYVMILLITQPDLNGDGVINEMDWFDYNQSGALDVDMDDVYDYRIDVAQWVANIVDFRDFDIINTPFEFDLNPFDGWDVDGDLLTDLDGGAMRRVVWGMERPDLLLTEAKAIHDRRTEDLASDSGDNDDVASGNDDDFDSRLIPVPAAFIELYNPQVRQHQPVELYGYPPTGGVILDRRTPSGNPVWRLAVVKGSEPYDPNNTDDDRNRIPNSYDPATELPDSDFERFIYFFDPGASLPALVADQLAFFPNFNPGVIDPGQYAVLGSTGNASTNAGEFTTTLGRLTTAFEPVDAATIDTTQSITLMPGSNQIRIRKLADDGTLEEVVRDGVNAIPIGNAVDSLGTAMTRPLAISDPIAGYPAIGPDGLAPTDVGDGLAYMLAYDTPVDVPQPAPPPVSKERYQFDAVRGTEATTATFAVIHLQRLANPLADFDPVRNPYLTYDRIGTDLTAFNGVTNAIDPSDDGDDTDVVIPGSAVALQTLERGNSETTGLPAIQRRLLWPLARNNEQTDIVDVGAVVSNHYFNRQFMAESIGELNTFFNDPAFATVPYPWMMFHNRPYVSQLELASVPWANNFNVFERFSITTSAEDPFTNVDDGFGHLPNTFHATQGPRDGSINLYRLFDYLEVPSRFLGTETYMNPAQTQGAPLSVDYQAHGPFGFNPPFNTLSRFRTPGKPNINTIFSEDVWNATIGRGYFSIFPYAQMDLSRRNAATTPAPGSLPTDFANPFRPGEAANYMPLNDLVPDLPVDCTLFRRNTALSDAFLDVNVAVTGAHNNSDRSAFFRNDARQRLGNLVTTRSSVFAVWITIGLFEVDPNSGDLLLLSPTTGIELGSDSGEIRRYRGFYLIDRSIPVAFQPGRNHNVDRTILIESIIE